MNAHEVSAQESSDKLDMVTCPMSAVSSSAEHVRKINISQFLYNLAATIHHVGRAATAESNREKQEAAFGIVTSLLNLAADASVKTKHKISEASVSDNADMVETRTVDVVVRVLEILENPEYRSVEENEPALHHLREVLSSDERRNLIAQELRTSEGKAALMGASLNVLKKAVEKRVILVVQALNNGDSDMFRSVDAEECEIELEAVTDQQVAATISTWWDQIVNFTTHNSLVVAIQNGFQDIYNYIYSFFTKPTPTTTGQ